MKQNLFTPLKLSEVRGVLSFEDAALFGRNLRQRQQHDFGKEPQVLKWQMAVVEAKILSNLIRKHTDMMLACQLPALSMLFFFRME